MVPRVRVDGEVIGPRGGPSDGPPERPGGPQDGCLFRVVIDLLAESPADIRGDDADLVLRDLERIVGDPLAQEVGILALRPEGVGGVALR